jgi:hypothetical protein
MTCRYKKVKVTKSIKTIAIQLSMDLIIFYLKLATSACTLADIKLFSGDIAGELSAIGL